MKTTQRKDTSGIITDKGFIHGRFQLFHNDHLKYLLAGRELCRHLLIGITNPDPTLTRSEDADPSRSRKTSNPFTYYERYQMIRESLLEVGVDHRTFSIVPFPVNLPDLYHHYAPMDATFFLSIYDAWGEKKLAYFQSLGLKTHVLWKVPIEKKGISGTAVRNRIRMGTPWESFVPQPVARLILAWDIQSRLRKDLSGS